MTRETLNSSTQAILGAAARGIACVGSVNPWVKNVESAIMMGYLSIFFLRPTEVVSDHTCELRDPAPDDREIFASSVSIGMRDL